ncbi:MAG TPA: hypothetical protein VMH91_01925 [Candidatus Paceibacterota bacterium]|nr:hypothetical protein [Candidatus Paceibacterota bacterium]
MELELELWNTVLNINSALLALASGYTVYAAGASIYYLTPRPIELAIILVFILLCTEVVFSALEEIS